MNQFGANCGSDHENRSTTSPGPFTIAVLISGSGRSLANLLRRIDLCELNARVALVIASRADIRGVQIAKDAGLVTEIISRRSFPDAVAHRDAVFHCCRSAGVQLVVMAGYLQHLLIPDDFVDKVINIHPSLLPMYGGHGFFGDRVHEAVLAAGDTQSGCTVHFVDDQFDHGPIIDQRTVPVLPGDSASDLAARIFEQECQLLPDVIQRLALQAGTSME